MADPVAKANIDENFELRLRDMRDAAKFDGAHIASTGQTRWYRPNGFEGSPLDPAVSIEPFHRQQANEEFIQAVGDSKAPGRVSDQLMTINMIESLSLMQRAFLHRHTMRRGRATCMVAARLNSQGSDSGVFIQNYLEYMRTLAAQGKS